MHGSFSFAPESNALGEETRLDLERSASARTARERAAEPPGATRFEEELALLAAMPTPDMREQVAALRAYAGGTSDAYRKILYSGWEDRHFAQLLEYARQWASEKAGK